MKLNLWLIILTALFAFSGCGQTEKNPNQDVPKVAQETEAGVSGDFRLIKGSGSGIFVLKDNKTSAITNYSWVERNAKGKKIETISDEELKAFTGSGIVYK
jgi:hypothetical protein